MLATLSRKHIAISGRLGAARRSARDANSNKTSAKGYAEGEAVPAGMSQL
jgi:hypothetical protein